MVFGWFGFLLVANKESETHFLRLLKVIQYLTREGTSPSSDWVDHSSFCIHEGRLCRFLRGTGDAYRDFHSFVHHENATPKNDIRSKLLRRDRRMQPHPADSANENV